MKITRLSVGVALIIIASVLITGSGYTSYLTAKGAKLYNAQGNAVRLTGVNWFGFETTNMFPHGLWARDYHGVLIQIKEMGFNCVRIPFCNQMLHKAEQADKPNYYGEDPFYPRDATELNKELADLSPLEMMDEIIRYAGEIGLVILLDNHSREHDGYMVEKLWYYGAINEQQWIDDWVMLGKRYKNNPTVVAFDLNNEPHGRTKDGGATWGAGVEKTDWNTAAEKCGNAVLAVNPDVLIIIEGVEQVGEDIYWWGGNLQGVKTHPITLSNPGKLVYSPHEYGPEVFQQPWFADDAFPGNMEKIWDDHFGYIIKENTAPLFVGEFGISSMNSFEGRAGIWFTKFLKYMTDNFFSWTFWALNPNSGDTGGILAGDWVSVVDWKLNAVKSMCAPLLNEPMVVSNNQYPHSLFSKKYKGFLRNGIVTFNGITGENTVISLYNLQGEAVMASHGNTLLINELPAGVYTAVVYINGIIGGRMVIPVR